MTCFLVVSCGIPYLLVIWIAINSPQPICDDSHQYNEAHVVMKWATRDFWTTCTNDTRHQQGDLQQVIIGNNHLAGNITFWAKNHCCTNNLTTDTEDTNILGKLF